MNRVLLEIKTSRTGKETVESMVQFLASLTNLRRQFLYFARISIPINLEIVVVDQTIRFYISILAAYQTFLESQLVAQYPKALMVKSHDFLPEVLAPLGTLAVGQMKLATGYLYPLKTYKDFKEVDPLSSLLGILSKLNAEDKMAIQFLLIPVSSSWQRAGEHASTEKYKDSSGITHTNPYAKAIAEKIGFNGFKVAIRLAANSTTRSRSKHILYEVANSFSSFSNPGGNSLVFSRVYLWQSTRLCSAMQKRSKRFVPSSQILNVQELATLFHFPGEKLATIHNISWHKTILSDPPENLPVAEGISEEEKKEINFFARTEYKNKPTIFGIKGTDRRKHHYLIGKTGSGKSTLIANMAINDMRNGRGFAVIDPHGDLSETLLHFIPSFRVNDVAYLDPSDLEYAFSLNPLEVENPHQKELVVSGIVAIFKKLYYHTWGPRLEYILRNTILSIIDLPDATFLMVPSMLTDNAFRAKALEHIHDQVLKNFWLNEFAQMPPKLKSESISPILNKVGQFIQSQVMRNIVGKPKSTINLEKMMNEGKIVLLNLSQGKLGEDNAALLGAMTITKIQLASMNRVNLPEEERRDFYLYIDEFQNFATSSFIKILSEARKYRLNLILANQYIAQIPEDVRAAIFGNAGTMMSFLIGAEDARYMAREFGERFTEQDLLALGNYQALIKLSIDGITQSPFLAQTLPLPKSATQNREKVIRNSRERYTKRVQNI